MENQAKILSELHQSSEGATSAAMDSLDLILGEIFGGDGPPNHFDLASMTEEIAQIIDTETGCAKLLAALEELIPIVEGEVIHAKEVEERYGKALHYSALISTSPPKLARARAAIAEYAEKSNG